jgi:hypothetical protein
MAVTYLGVYRKIKKGGALMSKWLNQFTENNNFPQTTTKRTAKADNAPIITKKTPATLCQQVKDELAALWQAGTRHYIEQHHPNLAKEIDTSEDQVNSSWLAADDGSGCLATFKQALETWRQANLKAIKAFKGGMIQ